MLSGGVSCIGQATARRSSRSKSPLTRQLTLTLVIQKLRGAGPANSQTEGETDTQLPKE